jgi:hypothetical protein
MRITGNDHFRLGGNGAGKNGIVIGIVGNDRLDWRGLNDGGQRGLAEDQLIGCHGGTL